MYEHLHGIEAGRASMPVQHKTPIYILLKFLVLKILQMPYFSELNPQIFGSH